MQDIIKILGVAIMCACVAAVIKSTNKDFGSIVKVVSAAILAGGVIICASPLIEFITDISEGSQINTYLSVMLKALGIAFLTHICASVCRDCGEQTIAGYAELAGKIEMLIISLPLIEDLIKISEDLVQMI